MTDQRSPDPPPELAEQQLQLLDLPAVWAAVDPGGEAQLLSAIQHEWAALSRPGGRRSRAGLLLAAVLGAVVPVLALLAATVFGVLELQRPRDPDPDPAVVALAPADGGPADAQAQARLVDQADGLRIELHVTGLPPAPAEEWYQVDLPRPDGGSVSAGSFHLRGGGERVILWAGLDLADEFAVHVTRQPADDLILRGTWPGG